ncbi:type III pantothenate kinase [Sulfurimonas sp. HSL-1716]|uniref:type III pantothenate kinase n=1 Tax=Hydrocurvibacter sulfurireducens TaxID=3131937 RepID=UPI0031F9CA37
MESTRLTLCDIGNTTFDFYREGVKEKIATADYELKKSEEKIFYICVNEKVGQELKNFPNWIDLKAFVDMKKYYETMGIDRIAVCESIENGVVIDAGSAITVDVVRKGAFVGGYIALGLSASHKAYTGISPRLDYSYNFEIDLDKIPKNSEDALTYAQVGLLYRDVMSYALPVYLTGGDAPELKNIFKDAVLDDELIFKGMKNIMKKADLC